MNRIPEEDIDALLPTTKEVTVGFDSARQTHSSAANSISTDSHRDLQDERSRLAARKQYA
jgi:hypothetical protein